MGLRIRTNIAALNAQRQLGTTTKGLHKSMERLASGKRINRAADDAAGLGISTNLQAKSRSMVQAKRNAQDGISMVEVAEGSLAETSNILIRLRELAIQTGSDTLTNRARSYAQLEYEELVHEIERLGTVTEFNEIKLLKGSDDMEEITIHVGPGANLLENTVGINVEKLRISTEEVLGLTPEEGIGPREPTDDFESSMARERITVLDGALNTVSNIRAELGAKHSRLGSAINNLSISRENVEASKSRIEDVDFAAETAQMTQYRILQQSGVSVLSHANTSPELALALLR